MKELTIFDIDDTIVDGQSQRLLLNFLYRNNYVSSLYFFHVMIWFVLYKIGLAKNPRRVMEFAYSFAKGKTVLEIDSIIDTFFENDLRLKIYPQALDMIQDHQRAEHEVILVSNAADFLVKRIADYFNVRTFFATKIEMDGNVCTGRITGEIMYGEQKLQAVKKYSQIIGIPSTEWWAYGDHASDVFLLSHSGHPFAVNPTKNLRKIALDKNWPILNLKK
jgi:HAD superfamily hydrolase (TIGR01490 family)